MIESQAKYKGTQINMRLPTTYKGFNSKGTANGSDKMYVNTVQSLVYS